MEATKLFYIDNTDFVEIEIFSPRSWNNSMVGVINFMLWLMTDQTNHSTDCVQYHAQGRVRWLLRGFVCLWNALRGEADY